MTLAEALAAAEAAPDNPEVLEALREAFGASPLANKFPFLRPGVHELARWPRAGPRAVGPSASTRADV